MKTDWLVRAGHPSLIVFCSGWAMDGKPFRHLAARRHDVLICYDYRTAAGSEDVAALLDRYRQATLLGWSMGVYYGQKCLAALAPRFARRLALNGTLAPVDDQRGIPVKLFRATLEGLDEQTLQRFFRRMHKPDGDYRRFLANRPERSLDGQRQELGRILADSGSLAEEQSIYTTAVISSSDYIVPTNNQLRFWQQTPVTMVEGAHFPFYRYSSWEEMLARLS